MGPLFLSKRALVRSVSRLRTSRLVRPAVALLLPAALIGGSLVLQAGAPTYRAAEGRKPTPKPELSGAPAAGAGPSDTAAEEAIEVYNSGRYKEAEAQASMVLRAAGARESELGARARWVQAFASARRGDLGLALQRFRLLEDQAAGRSWTIEPESSLSAEVARRNSSETAGVESSPPPVDRNGQPMPTLEEDAAYQQAVLTAALARGQSGSKASTGGAGDAEGLFIRFMQRYPESPLVHAAVRRIGMLHGGEIPARAQKVWQQAMATAAERAEARAASGSDCGPETLSEALRRLGLDGPSAAVSVLMAEMGTTSRGTTMAAMAKAAEGRGCRARGLLRDEAGLRKLMAEGPEGQVVIAFVRSSHFVIVERARGSELRYWDPAASEAGGRDDLPGGPSGTRSAPDFLWRKNWQGHLLVLQREDAPAGAGEG